VAGHLLLRARRAADAHRLRHRPAIDLSPLYGLRLRTPRLELRLPDDDEIVALAHVAEQGVHPPEEMPFFVAWTDRIGEPDFVDGFVAFHRLQREEWRPDRWHLLLGVWAGGEAMGTQGMDAERFAERRTAETGSWLGRRYQRRGYGTEMRAAMLALLFDGLGGEAATSGALDGNPASARVAEKLGYVVAGETTAAPRGVPVRQLNFRLERADWRPPFDVEIAGLEPCLPLFGL
jgi:RimJ/RimL family protein N-acetyltransferase